MLEDGIRSRVAKRLALEKAPPPASARGRHAGLIAGLTKAGAKSFGRAVKRSVGGHAADIEPETEIVALLGRLKGPVTKVGQALGYLDIGLPASLRSALSALQTSAQ